MSTPPPMKFKDVSKSPRELLVSVLARNDRNGIWTDEDREGEGWSKLSKQEAMTEVYGMLVAYQDEAKFGEKVTFDQIVAASVKAILDDLGPLLGKKIPMSTRKFSALHDYIDANMLGGATLLLTLYGQDAVDVLNMSQEIVDHWLGLDPVNRAQWVF